jgi:8-oxo-dGTP pyrophosphatase MutT (NUDIX family)
VSQPLDPAAVPIRPAATVLLIRDAHDATNGAGIEVFMLRRTLQAVFASGMYVFPGGRLDDVDSGVPMEAVCDGITDRHASTLLGLDRGGLAYWVAAIRECFEEAGVLMARRVGSGDAIRFDDPSVAARFEFARHQVHDSSLGLVELCAREGLRLMTDRMSYIAHWITPRGEQRRFDTRFFVAQAPAAQVPLHDDGETIASLWVRPADALERADAGELLMLPPTIACLRFLEPHASTAAAMDAAGTVGVPPTILPKIVSEPGAPLEIVMPGDSRYDALP